MSKSLIFPTKWLTYDPVVLKRLAASYVYHWTKIRGRLSVTIHNSDPYYCAVFYLDDVPVVVENCIDDYEAWLEALPSDEAFLLHVESR